MALSKSLKEEENTIRSDQEEKLLSLGFSNIVDEDRFAKPITFLQLPKGSVLYILQIKYFY